MERKLDVDKEHDMIKYLLEDCIPHDFVRHMYKQENYAAISKPNLTSQKTNNIFKNYLLEESNRINILKYKYGEKFPLIHCIYLLLFSKIYNRTNNFGILSTAKDPSNYQDREFQKNEQMPIDIKISDNDLVRPTMVSVNNTTDESIGKKQAEKRKMSEKQLSKNTLKMNKIKKSNKL